jgi:diacylglycerol kinase family enzyme
MPKTKTRVIFGIACGDGTILSLLDEACLKERIDLNSIQVCALPFGTGNDFSQIFGWGQ